ncbi:MAG: winged helix DNA-binding domain-containing protein [Bacteroidota bacterium]|nr:winged helix DNA-binding domain-containing protein [Bacteroidota bacterium]
MFYSAFIGKLVEFAIYFPTDFTYHQILTMTFNDISYVRLASQQIAGTKFKTAKEIVCWMGAMQAQDYSMAKWAVGVRLPGSTDKDIETAVNKGDIIRTHVLRPTWHFVSPADIYWMLELTAPRIKSSLKSRHKQLELTESVIKKSYSIIEKALIDGQHFTRNEIFSKLEKANVATGNQRGIHILLRAELDGIICSGTSQEKQQTYALLEERVPKKKLFQRDEALAQLANKYFTSHCPATVQDFIWWSGLPVADAKNALEMVRANFYSEKINSQTYWFRDSASPTKNIRESAHLLPAYDEFIISYKDRSAALSSDIQKKTISDNGIFWPVIVINGKVTGKWRRTMTKDTIVIETEFFQPLTKSTKNLIEKASLRFGNFLNLKIERF